MLLLIDSSWTSACKISIISSFLFTKIKRSFIDWYLNLYSFISSMKLVFVYMFLFSSKKQSTKNTCSRCSFYVVHKGVLMTLSISYRMILQRKLFFTWKNWMNEWETCAVLTPLCSERIKSGNDYYRNQQFSASLITQNQIIILTFSQSCQSLENRSSIWRTLQLYASS